MPVFTLTDVFGDHWPVMRARISSSRSRIVSAWNGVICSGGCIRCICVWKIAVSTARCWSFM